MDLMEKEWYIAAPWGRIAIIAWGNCLDEPVLMTHGRVDSVVNFKPLLHHLPRNFYYVGVEIPGHGKSDPYPKGLMLNTFDVVYVLRVVVKHFRWKNFIYMGHSLATLVGKIYNLSYPGEMSRVIDLDPTPAYEAIPPEEFVNWYHKYYTQYFNNYHKFNASKETAPKYTREKALALIERNRGITGEAANIILDRLSEPIGENFIRFTFDQRSKLITRPPFPASHRKKLFTSIETPTLTIVADRSIKLGLYDQCPFALDENAFPKKNYRVREVAGNHDVHVIHPESVARYVTPFLLYGLEGIDKKAKL